MQIIAPSNHFLIASRTLDTSARKGRFDTCHGYIDPFLRY